MLCPHCGEPLNELIEVSSCVRRVKLLVNQYNTIDAEEIDIFGEEGEVLHYECPGCDEIVAYTPGEATKILKGEQ